MHAYAEWKGRRFLLTSGTARECHRVAESTRVSYGLLGVRTFATEAALSTHGILIDLIESLERADAHKSHFERSC